MSLYLKITSMVVLAILLSIGVLCLISVLFNSHTVFGTIFMLLVIGVVIGSLIFSITKVVKSIISKGF